MKVTIVVGGRWYAFDLAKELYLKGHLYRLITNYPYFAIKKWGIPKEYIVSLPTTFFLVKAIYWLGGESLMMKCQWLVHSWFDGLVGWPVAMLACRLDGWLVHPPCH